MPVLVSQELFPIDVKYVEVKLKSGLTGCFVIDNAEAEEKYAGKIQVLHTQWKMPTWKETNDLIRESTEMDMATGDRQVNVEMWQGLAIERFLKAWDVAGADNKNVPCNKANIEMLDPTIFRSLMNQFMARNTPSEEDLKN